jgi:hypothetical protein
MFMPEDQNAGQNHNTKIENKSFERVGTVPLFRNKLLSQNSIQEETKSRLKSGNAFCHSVQNLLSSSLLSNSIKVEKYRTTILPVVLHGC